MSGIPRKFSKFYNSLVKKMIYSAKNLMLTNGMLGFAILCTIFLHFSKIKHFLLDDGNSQSRARKKSSIREAPIQKCQNLDIRRQIGNKCSTIV